MAWRVINNAKIVKDDVTGDVGILTQCGDVTKVGKGAGALSIVYADIYNAVTIPAGEYAEIVGQTAGSSHPFTAGDTEALLGTAYINTLELTGVSTDMSKLTVLSVTSLTPLSSNTGDRIAIRVYNGTSDSISIAGYTGKVNNKIKWTVPSSLLG